MLFLGIVVLVCATIWSVCTLGSAFFASSERRA